jgi:hypothetical protein
MPITHFSINYYVIDEQVNAVCIIWTFAYACCYYVISATSEKEYGWMMGQIFSDLTLFPSCNFLYARFYKNTIIAL